MREGSRLYNQQTYPKLLHFFFLKGGHHEQRSIKGRDGRVGRGEKETKLRKRKTTKTTKRKQFYQRPMWKRGKQMVTPVGSDIIWQRHTLIAVLCVHNIWQKYVKRKQLPEGTFVRRSSCRTQAWRRALDSTIPNWIMSTPPTEKLKIQ